MSKIQGSVIKKFPFVVEDYLTNRFYTETDYEALVRSRTLQIQKRYLKSDMNATIVDSETGLRLAPGKLETLQEHSAKSVVIDRDKLPEGLQLMRRNDHQQYEHYSEIYRIKLHRELSYEDYKLLRDFRSLEGTGLQILERLQTSEQAHPIDDKYIHDLLQADVQQTRLERLTELALNSPTLKSYDVGALRNEVQQALLMLREESETNEQRHRAFASEAERLLREAQVVAREQRAQFQQLTQTLKEEVANVLARESAQLREQARVDVRQAVDALKREVAAQNAQMLQQLTIQQKQQMQQVKAETELMETNMQQFQRMNALGVQQLETHLSEQLEQALNRSTDSFSKFETTTNNNIQQLQSQINALKQVLQEFQTANLTEKQQDLKNQKQQFDALFQSAANNGQIIYQVQEQLAGVEARCLQLDEINEFRAQITQVNERLQRVIFEMKEQKQKPSIYEPVDTHKIVKKALDTVLSSKTLDVPKVTGTLNNDSEDCNIGICAPQAVKKNETVAHQDSSDEEW